MPGILNTKLIEIGYKILCSCGLSFYEGQVFFKNLFCIQMVHFTVFLFPPCNLMWFLTSPFSFLFGRCIWRWGMKDVWFKILLHFFQGWYWGSQVGCFFLFCRLPCNLTLYSTWCAAGCLAIQAPDCRKLLKKCCYFSSDLQPFFSAKCSFIVNVQAYVSAVQEWPWTLLVAYFCIYSQIRYLETICSK